MANAVIVSPCSSRKLSVSSPSTSMRYQRRGAGPARPGATRRRPPSCAQEIDTWHPNGQGRSPLAAALGKLTLRGAGTTRNWNTAQKLVEMLVG